MFLLLAFSMDAGLAGLAAATTVLICSLDYGLAGVVAASMICALLWSSASEYSSPRSGFSSRNHAFCSHPLSSSRRLSHRRLYRLYCLYQPSCCTYLGVFDSLLL